MITLASWDGNFDQWRSELPGTPSISHSHQSCWFHSVSLVYRNVVLWQQGTSVRWHVTVHFSISRWNSVVLSLQPWIGQMRPGPEFRMLMIDQLSPAFALRRVDPIGSVQGVFRYSRPWSRISIHSLEKRHPFMTGESTYINLLGKSYFCIENASVCYLMQMLYRI